MSRNAADTVETLLRDQRRALLAGDLAALAALPDRLDRAMRRLMAAPPDADRLAALSAAARDNARLVDAARGGLARVTARTAPATATLTTYDSRGQRQGAAAPGQTLSRR
ncbi:hypothetical protein [Roseicyclus persicicus]|uniref:Flagellar biosynthesis protein FlgN n=1 Tax=Roseicyclus persicicus TaxID=2650661 RepID=A0A7X6GZ03_9RHOB|nr:hypothetical protein [Roseibacterium persicicum]NKX45002.1 hypothetical protein [Roseibacterium persicicum]